VVTVYEADKVAAGKASLTAKINQREGLRFYYQGELLKLETIRAAWYRRPNLFGPFASDRLKQISLDGERKALQEVMWGKIPEERWLNAPQSMRYADQKLVQLELARSLGMTIPATIVSNRQGNISKYLPEKAVFKAVYSGLLHEAAGIKHLYTTPVDLQKLPPKTNPFPGLWQPYITKKREWRITVVGHRVFAAAIYTKGEAKADWRHPKYEKLVQMRKEAFPDDIKHKCLQYLKQLGLRYGAFDFIETEAGEIVFLECNPNGQYGWLETDLGLPISKAIADELLATQAA